VKTKIIALVTAIIVTLSVATIGLSSMKPGTTSSTITTTTITTMPTTPAQTITPVAQQMSGTNNAVSNNNQDNALLIKFAANAEMIKGHIGKAIENKEASNLELAKAHAGHPIAEHYTVLEPLINQTDPQLSGELKQSLTSLVDRVEDMSVLQFKLEADKTLKLLDQAYSEVIPEAQNNDIKFSARTVIGLVTQATEEYEEGVKDGKIVQVVEYQDAQAFVGRAEAVFNQIANDLTSQERDVAQDQFKQLVTSMNATNAPSVIDEKIKAVITGVSEGAGIANANQQVIIMGQQSANISIYIQNVRDLLKQVSIQYQQGNHTGAETLAVTAYLDNFENVEGPLIQANQTQLKLDTEKMLRVELRDMIKNRVDQRVLDAQIAAIDAKLDQIAKALS
jgi:hypothetical protein